MSTFIPENDLEKKIIQAQNGEISAEQFLRDMLVMQVFMPIQDKSGIGGFQDSQQAVPLSVKDDEGEMIILFTSPERAKEFVKDYPGFGGGLLEDFNWIIEKIGGGYGVILNPGYEIGLELEANMLAQLGQQQP